MRLYCLFEGQFADQEELRAFWFDMARHESRHFAGLALVAGLLESSSKRRFDAGESVAPERIAHLHDLVDRCIKEAKGGVSVERSFELALIVEGSELEDIVFGMLQTLKGDAEHERAIKLLIHDLGDLSYMIEKHTKNQALLKRADQLLDRQVDRLRPQRRASPRKLRRVTG